MDLTFSVINFAAVNERRSGVSVSEYWGANEYFVLR